MIQRYLLRKVTFAYVLPSSCLLIFSRPRFLRTRHLLFELMIIREKNEVISRILKEQGESILRENSGSGAEASSEKSNESQETPETPETPKEETS